MDGRVKPGQDERRKVGESDDRKASASPQGDKKKSRQLLLENRNPCYNAHSSESAGVMRRASWPVAVETFEIGLQGRDFFTPNGCNPLKSPDSKK
jgi:hypothetical protein